MAVIVCRQRNTDAPGSGAVLLFDFLYHFKYIGSMLDNEKPIEWMGSSHKDLMALPADIMRFFSFALSLKIAEAYVKGLRK
jgi:hypothetical protein